MPGGVTPCAPVATIVAGTGPCVSKSQLAVFIACQIPFRSGLPSGSRGTFEGADCEDTEIAAAPSANVMATARIERCNTFRIRFLSWAPERCGLVRIPLHYPFQRQYLSKCLKSSGLEGI